MGRKPAETQRDQFGVTLNPVIIESLDRIAKDLNVPRNIIIEEAIVRAFHLPDLTPFSDVMRDRGIRALGGTT